jgi:FkbM family methyltransferase
MMLTAASKTFLWAIRNTILGRGKMRDISGRLFCALLHGPVETTVWGAPVTLHPTDNRSEWKALFRPDRYDRAEFSLLDAAMRQHPGSVFIDIGANAGMYSLRAAMAGANARIVAIEPNPTMVARAARNLSQFPGATAIPAALGDHNGTASLRMAGEFGCAHIGDGDTPAETMPVRMRRLSDVLTAEGITQIDAMKIDVEGYEDRALFDFITEAPFAMLPKLLIMEHKHSGKWVRDLFGALRSRGYAETLRNSSNSCLVREATRASSVVRHQAAAE